MARTFSMKICPYCGKTLDWSFKYGYGDGKLKIGITEIYPCKHCGKMISNGLKEWPEMTEAEKFKEKLKFVFSSLAFGLLYGLGGFGLLSILIPPLRNYEFLMMFIGFILLTSISAYGAKIEVDNSKERYNSRKND